MSGTGAPAHPHGAKGRYADFPRQIPFAGWKDILIRTFWSLISMDTTLRCAGIAFFSFLSLFPVIASAVILYGLVADPATLQDHLLRAEMVLPGMATDILREQLNALLSQPESNLGISLLLTLALALWSGSRGTNALVYSITRAHREAEDRDFIGSTLMSFAMTVAGAVYLLLALGAIAVLPVMVALIPVPDSVESILLFVRWPILLGFAVLGFALLYHFAPNRRPARFRWMWPGAILASVLFMGVSILFSLYVENFGNYEASFGSVAAAVVLMLWLYNSALIVLLGATLDAEIEYQTEKDTTVGPPKPMGQRGAFVADHVAEDDLKG